MTHLNLDGYATRQARRPVSRLVLVNLALAASLSLVLLGHSALTVGDVLPTSGTPVLALPSSVDVFARLDEIWL